MLYLLSFSLTSYVYAVGKQPTSTMWCEMVERGGVRCEMWEWDNRYAFCKFYVLFYARQNNTYYILVYVIKKKNIPLFLLSKLCMKHDMYVCKHGSDLC